MPARAPTRFAVMTAAIGEVFQQTPRAPEAAQPGGRTDLRRVSVVARFQLHRESENLGQRRPLPGLLRLRGAGVDRSSRGNGSGTAGGGA